jgi:5'-nucleotidase
MFSPLRISRLYLLILTVFLAIQLSCSLKGFPRINLGSEPTASELIIVSTNDFHAGLDRAEGIANIIHALRSRYGEKMIYLDGGDEFQGSLEGNMSKGKAIVEFFNLIGLDAGAVGNHDLDYGADVPDRTSVLPGEDGLGTLKARMKESKYPWVSSNFILDPPQHCEVGDHCNALGQKTIAAPRVVLIRGGKRIGVIGGTTPSTKNITQPDFIQGTRFEPLVPVIRAEAKYLRKKEECDYVILVVHEGVRYIGEGKTLQNSGLFPVLRELPRGTVDAVIAGHTHIRVQVVVNGFPVIQTGSSGERVGVLHLIRKRNRKSFRFDPFIIVPEKAENQAVSALLKPYREVVMALKKKPVGVTTDHFPRYKLGESALGNLICDALLEVAKIRDKAQFCLINAGGIRSELPQGSILYDDVFKVLPFENNLVVVELTGSELRRLLEVAFSGELGVSSVSGLQVKRLDIPVGLHGSWDRDLNRDGKKDSWERNLILDVRDQDGRPIENNATYRLATIQFLAFGADYQDIVYDKLPPNRFHVYQDVMLRDVVADYIKQRSPIQPSDFYSEGNRRILTVAQ